MTEIIWQGSEGALLLRLVRNRNGKLICQNLLATGTSLKWHEVSPNHKRHKEILKRAAEEKISDAPSVVPLTFSLSMNGRKVASVTGTITWSD